MGDEFLFQQLAASNIETLDRHGLGRRAKKIVDELDACEVSRVFTLKRPRRGGVGIGSAVKAGHKDSIEDLVRDWSGPRPPRTSRRLFRGTRSSATAWAGS